MKQHYVGTKQIIAWPEEKDGAEGYAVQYEDGYTSWSPKEVFEAAYLPMGHVGHLHPHEQRVVAELVQIDANLTKLRVFMAGAMFSLLEHTDRHLLEQQEALMDAFTGILGNRIKRFNRVLPEYLKQDQGLEPVEYFDNGDIAKLTVPEREGMFGYDPLQDGGDKA